MILQESSDHLAVFSGQIQPRLKIGQWMPHSPPVGAIPQAFMAVIESKAQGVKEERNAGCLGQVSCKAIGNTTQNTDAGDAPRDGLYP